MDSNEIESLGCIMKKFSQKVEKSVKKKKKVYKFQHTDNLPNLNQDTT